MFYKYFVHIYVYHMQAWYLRRSEEAIRTPGTGGFKFLYGFWQVKPKPCKNSNWSVEPFNQQIVLTYFKPGMVALISTSSNGKAEDRKLSACLGY